MRIQLFNPDQVTPEAVADYLSRNRDFLQPYESAHEDEYYTARHWKRVLAAQFVEMEQGRGLYFYISEAGGADRVIGTITMANLVMGPMCSGLLGYRLDREYLNRGYMTEAVEILTDYAFAALGLHRIEAYALPRNAASLRVLEKCGFRAEGIARAYMRVNGVWEDHVRLARINDNWTESAEG